MASSQVEIASSAPFGCVLREHNHKHNHSHNNHNRLDGCKTAQDAFRRNLKDLVRGHIHKCIPVSSSSSDSGSHQEPSSFNQNPWFADHKRINNHGSLRLKRVDTSSPSSSYSSSKEESLSDISPRQSRIPERWAAQQDRDMVSTIEKQSNEAELVTSTSISTASSDDASTDTDISNLGASSLVQVWEARLNRSSSNSCSSKVNSAQPASPTLKNNAPLASSSPMEESSMISDVVELVGDSDRLVISTEGSLGRSESERTVIADDQSSVSQDKDSGAGNQSQWVRVADIIKRLTTSRKENDHKQSNSKESSLSKDRERSPVSDQSFHPVTPRLRGRLAFNDLLMQLEHERHRELESLAEIQAVSRFQQRGRIQSHLKLKILQHRNGVQPQSRPNQPNNVPHNSGIMHLRERFNTSTDNGSPRRATSRNSHEPHANNTLRLENSVTTNMSVEDHHSSHVVSLMQQSTGNSSPIDEPTNNTHHKGDHHNYREQCALPLHLSKINTNGDVKKGNWTPRSDAMSQHTSFEDTTDELQPLDTFSSFNDWFEDAMMEDEEKEEDEEVDSEEEQQQYIVESSYDWFSNISRPRSYWENRRQEWYKEMLESGSVNEDIRELLQRKTVSSFLSSDFSDRMNHLMMSHIQTQSHLEALEEEDQMETSIEERLDQLMSSYLHQQSNSVSNNEETDGVADDDEEEGEAGNDREEILEEDNDEGQEDEEGNSLGEIINVYDEGEENGEGNHREEMTEDYDGEEEDDEGNPRDGIMEDDDEAGEIQEQEQIPTRHQYNELQTYYDQATPMLQMSPSSPSRLGNYHEINSDREQVASTSSQDLPPYRPYYQDTQHHTNPIERLSIEMELINDLRAQMKQLYQEMSELRKSINCCMDMQVKLQGSFGPDSNSAQAKGKRLLDAAPRQGICCICYETQVDSLLYRCGHMCTCLRCAHELQWGSGKCPICRAPIVDVVRAFTDS